jgi:LPS export ABC transporter protein LptC
VVLQTKASIIIALALAILLLPACGRRNKNIATIDINATLPVLHGEDITSLISDSGVTRFRLQTKVWDAYANDTTSYWYFPEGIYVEQFDSLFQVSGHVQADTAYYYDKTGLWRLLSNVLIKNAEGTTCKTSEMFWNSKEPSTSLQSLYSDKFVEIATPTKLITTVGFKSNQSLTSYIFYDNTLITDIDEGEGERELKDKSEK